MIAGREFETSSVPRAFHALAVVGEATFGQRSAGVWTSVGDAMEFPSGVEDRDLTALENEAAALAFGNRRGHRVLWPWLACNC